MRILSDLRGLQLSAASLLFLAMAGTVGLALALQYIWGFVPCELCLLERIPFYVGAAAAVLAFLVALCHISPKLVAGLFIFIALLMLYDAGLSLYHVGVELKYWPGPASCSSSAVSLPARAGALLDSLNKTRIVPCNIAAGYIFGISFAGWSGITAFVFAVCAVFAAYFPFYARRKFG